jgi:hypothetical protein
MPKNVTIRPYPTTGFPSIEFINATGNAVKLNVKDDGSIVFSGVTYGDNLVTLTADGTKLIVKGSVVSENYGQGQKTNFGAGDNSYIEYGAPESTFFQNTLPAGFKGDLGPQGPKGDKQVKGDKGPTGAQGPLGPTGPIGSDTQGDKGNKGIKGGKGTKGGGGDKGLKGAQGSSPKGPKGPQGSSPIGPQGTGGGQGSRGNTGGAGDSTQGAGGPTGRFNTRRRRTNRR